MMGFRRQNLKGAEFDRCIRAGDSKRVSFFFSDPPALHSGSEIIGHQNFVVTESGKIVLMNTSAASMEKSSDRI